MDLIVKIYKILLDIDIQTLRTVEIYMNIHYIET